MSGLGQCGAGQEELRYKPAALSPAPGFQQHTHVMVLVFLQPPHPPGRVEIPFIFSSPKKKPGRQAICQPGHAGVQETALSDIPRNMKRPSGLPALRARQLTAPPGSLQKSSQGWTAWRVPWSSQQDRTEPTMPTGLSPTTAPRFQPGGFSPSREGKRQSSIFQESRGIFSTALTPLCAGTALLRLLFLPPPPTLPPLCPLTATLCPFPLSNRIPEQSGLGWHSFSCKYLSFGLQRVCSSKIEGQIASAYHGIV